MRSSRLPAANHTGNLGAGQIEAYTFSKGHSLVGVAWFLVGRGQEWE